MSDSDFRDLGDESAIKRWPVAAFYVSDLKKRVAVARVGDELYAFDDMCPRDKSSLAGGLLKADSKQIMCQCGGCHFDITTGEVKSGPAKEGLATYQARQSDGKLQVRI